MKINGRFHDSRQEPKDRRQEGEYRSSGIQQYRRHASGLPPWKSRWHCPSMVPLAVRRRRWQYHAVHSPARPAMKIDRIDHLNITVADIDRSVEFYQRVLGMTTER